MLARLVWLDDSDRSKRAMDYPPGAAEPGEGGWTSVSGVYRAPDGATRARLELHLRWTAHGEVLWRGAELRGSEPPAPRRVRLAAVNHRPQGTTWPDDNREDPEVVIAEVDLAERTLWPWLRDWRSRIWREAPAWADKP